jgi:hypothetical protein
MPQRDGQPERPPEEWKSGDEPMTESQASFLKRLSDDAGAEFDPNLTKAAASRRIDDLLSKGRGATPPKRSRASASRGGAAPSAATNPETRPRVEPSEASGEEPMTKAQAAYLKELAEEMGGDFEPDLTKEKAARRIGELLIKQMAKGSPTAPSRR